MNEQMNEPTTVNTTVNQKLRLRSRSTTLVLLVGSVTVLLIPGLLLPYAVGDRTASSAPAPAPGGGTGSVPAGGGERAAPSSETSAESSTSLGNSVGGVVPGASASRAVASGAVGGGPVGTVMPAEGLTASDQGVTPKEVRIGVVIPDLGTIGRAGFNAAGDPQETVRQWQAYIDDINDRGGILGRRIAAFFEIVDIVNADDRRRACLALTRDRKVFAVLSDQALQKADILCVTDENRRPFLAGADIPNEAFAKSRGLLFSHDAGAARVLANMAWLYDAEAGLRGKKIGIVSNEASNSATEEGLLPTLRALGYQVVHHARLPLLPSDAESQVPVEVAEMKRKEVDLVFLAIDPINGSLFVRQSDAQLFRPQWVTADNSANTNDTAANYHADTYEGAIAVTALRAGWFRPNEPEAAFDARCRAVLRAKLGTAPDPQRTRTASESSKYATATRACGIVQLFLRGATAAGAKLSAASWSTAMQGLGAVELGFSAPGSLQAGKFAAGGDQVRFVRFRADCGGGENCWVPAGAWRAARY